MNITSTVWDYYKAHKRDLLWRMYPTTYNVFVSEFMLQQTQVARVEIQFKKFLETFPSFESLAKATFKDVLITWQGLGYNRRAKYIWESAKRIIEDKQEGLLRSSEYLRKLPGIGAYTSCSIPCFAYNIPKAFIETNIRTVYIYHYFKNKEGITDQEILVLIDRDMDKVNPREWYYALMDYGVFLKKTKGNLNQKSKHYTKQTKFEGSNRQLRSKILACVIHHPRTYSEILSIMSQTPKERVVYIVEELVKEQFIQLKRGKLKVFK